MQNNDFKAAFRAEFNELKQHLEELHVLNIKFNASPLGEESVKNFLERATGVYESTNNKDLNRSGIQESDFLLNSEENAKICATLNGCLRSINKIINEKSNCKNPFSDTFLNTNLKVHHIKQIIEQDPKQENKDFLANIIKGCEILGNTLYKFQETGEVSKNECVTDIYKAAYSIANNLTKEMKKDKSLQNFFDNHHLRIDSMIPCPPEGRYFADFATHQHKNYQSVVDPKNSKGKSNAPLSLI